MTRNLLRAGALSCALLTTTALTTPAYAQLAREHRTLDSNGVDLTHGDFVMNMTEGSIGSGDAELALVRTGAWFSGYNGHHWDNITFERTARPSGGDLYTVTVGTRWEQFTGGGTLPSGSTLSGSGNSFIYRRSDGTAIEFTDAGSGGWGSDSNYCTGDPAQGNCSLLPTSITSPDGKTVNLNWTVRQQCWDIIEAESLPCTFDARLYSVSNSFGYEIRFTYSTNQPGSGGTVPAWFQRTSATFHNNNVSGNPAQGSVSYAYPSTGVTQVTDMGGQVWRITGSFSNITAIRRPGASSDTTTITRNSGGVSSVTRDGVTTNYARTISGNTASMTVTQVDGDPGTPDPQTVVVSDLTIGRPTSVTNALAQTTGYQYDTHRRLTRVTSPEGNYVQYSYDARGNVIETRAVAKPGAGLPDIVSTASFDATCLNPVTCNRPNSVTDARGNTTDFIYDGTHGGVLTTFAPTVGGVRAQTRFTYNLISGEHRLTEVSACATGTAPSCVGTAAETRTVLGHDANGNVTSVQQRSGNTSGPGAVSAITTSTYTPLGDVASIDGPLSGTADTVRYRYNAGRQVVGTVGPDPDGAGSLKHRAQRISYSNGLASKIETGTVNSQSDADWLAFASLEEAQTEYDAHARPLVQRLVSGGTTYALTQTSYDALGRTRCVAQRMNPAEFGASSLPSDACTLDTQSSFGPDRIIRTSYDAAGQVTLVQNGFGVTGVQADAVATAYTNNGQVQHVTDGEGNRTTYEYDGHDRRGKIRFPSPTTDGVSSTTDYELLTFDANGNVTSRRLRDGNSIGVSYDALNRMTAKDLPGSEPTVSYGYDLLGRLTSASTASQTLTFTFDALGRNLTQVGPHGTVSSVWNDAGRRTSLTYADSGLVVGYTYNDAGEVTAIRENPSGSNVLLASFAYDDRGRRTSLTRGNGTTTTYGYDSVSRLNELVQNLNGSADDLTLGFGHNPASQIVSATRSDDGFSFTGLANQNVVNTHNGLNQVTVTGTTTVSHDNRGNVSGVGSSSYGYSSENLLVSAPGGVSLSYDPLLRLHQVSGSTTTRLGYDGDRMIAEYNSANQLQRRYVFGPGSNEPIVWYEGSGTSDRRYFHADERGSIVALSDNAGSTVGTVNRYDELGDPQGSVTGRFGYTGQAWLPELGLWYFRARVYHPRLGRFMQTDPLGYADGLNHYAYVAGDPINLSDPSGTLGESCPGTLTNACAHEAEELYRGKYPKASAGEVSAAVQYILGGSSLEWAQHQISAARFESSLAAVQPGLAEILEDLISLGKTIGGEWETAAGYERGGLPFFGISHKGDYVADTLSFTRSQALSSALYIMDVNQSSTPFAQYWGGNQRGRDIGLRGENVWYYVYQNRNGAFVGIREDRENRFQPAHFNSGFIPSPSMPSQILINHHYWVRP